MRFQLMPALRWLACASALLAAGGAAAQSPQFSKEQLDQLTAQVALYPDALLSQVLMASTYPADVAEAAKWSRAHANDKGDAAVNMVENEPWDPSVKSLVAFPQVIIMMGEKPDWVKDLGDAFLAQPDAVMDSVQRLRAAAQKAGNLQTNEQVTVTTETAPPPDVIVEAGSPPPPPQVIVIEQRSPEIIYVPSYNPIYVYGPWLWPAYPPYYVPYPPGYWFSSVVATGIAWGIGIGISNAIWGNCNWWNHNVNINVNRYNNINRNNRIEHYGNRTNWSHNVENRRATPYRGGDAERQNLQNRARATSRDQYRGREADRARAQQSLQNRGISTDRAQLSDANRAQLQQQARSLDRSGAQARSFDRSGVQTRDRAGSQGFDRSQAYGRAGEIDRSSRAGGAQPRNEAFQGVNNRGAGSEINRGNASRQSMQGMQRSQAQSMQRSQAQSMQRSGGGARAPSGGGMSRGGGGAPRGGGGGRGGGGRR